MSNQFKSKLQCLENEFTQYLHYNNCKYMDIKQVSVMLQKYINYTPYRICDTLKKSVGHQQIVWDDLLQFLQTQIDLQDSVLKLENNRYSITETKWNTSQQYSKIIQYIKQKQTNLVQQIIKLPFGMNQLIGIFFENQFIIYNSNQNQIINICTFTYQHIKNKLINKIEQQEIKNNLNKKKKQSKFIKIINHSTKNRKSFSFTKSIENQKKNLIQMIQKERKKKKKFQNQYQIDKKLINLQKNIPIFKKNKSFTINNKSTIIRVQHNEVNRVFNWFCQSSLQNSINISEKYKKSCNQGTNYIQLDCQHIIKQQLKDKLYQPSAFLGQRNYYNEIFKMKNTSKQLSIKKNKIKQKLHYRSIASSTKHYNNKNMLKCLNNKTNKKDKELLESKCLEIMTSSFVQNYMLLSLYNCEIRLYIFKKVIHNYSYELIFSKDYKHFVSHVVLYRSIFRNLFNITICINQQYNKQIIVYHLNKNMQIQSEAFSCLLNNSYFLRSVLPLGIAALNQLGEFALIQLNNPLNPHCQEKTFQQTLINNTLKATISLRHCKIDRSLILLYLGCNNGFIYIFDRHSREINKQRLVTNNSILDMDLIKNDQQIILLTSKSDIIIVSCYNLNRMYVHSTYNSISVETSFVMIDNLRYLTYTNKNINCFQLIDNYQKRFIYEKPVKILNSRLKMLKRQSIKKNIQKKLEKQQIIRCIEGYGGSTTYVILFIKHGQIMVYDYQMQYVGSYHMLALNNVMQLTLDNNLQYIGLLYIDHQIQIINLYTQDILFKINLEQQTCHQQINSCQLMFFNDEQNREHFFSYISNSYCAIILNRKGIIQKKIQLCTENIIHFSYLYNHLITVNNKKQLIVYHNKFFTINFTINFSSVTSDVVQIKKSERDYMNGNYIIALLIPIEIHLINLNNRQNRIIVRNDNLYNLTPALLVDKSISYNEAIIIRIQKQTIKGYENPRQYCMIYQITTKIIKEISLEYHQQYIGYVLPNHILVINLSINQLINYTYEGHLIDRVYVF